MSGDRKQFGTTVVRLAQCEESLATIAQDPGHLRISLGVVDGGRLAIQAEVCREWRFEPRLSLLAFKRLEQSRFFAADVSAKTGMGMQIVGKAATKNVIAKVAGGARFV